MRHQDAIETLAAERYVLGEMNENDANEFEEHYFGCGECADAVRNGTTFFDSGKSVVRERKKEARKRGLLSWFPSAAAAMVTMVVGYLLPHAQVMPAVALVSKIVPLSSQTRAGATENIVPLRRGQDTVVLFDILSDTPYPAYRWELRDASGKAIKAHEVSPEQAKDPIPVSLTSSLPAGQYVLVVEGVRKDGNVPVTRVSFNAKPVE